MNKTKNTTKRVRSATVFALVEGLIILLFIVLGAANLFFTNGTANRRTRQLVEDSYRGQIDNLTNDIRNVSLAGFSLMSNETVVRLKSYYFDKIQHDSYARNAAINSTMAALLSLTTYYDILDSCALWIAPDGELSYNTLYTFVGDDTRREMLDAEIAAHRYSPTFDENLHNRNGKVFISLSLSETDHAVLAMMLNTDYLTKALSLPVLPQLETAAYAADGDRLCMVCSDDKDPLTALTDRTATDKPILEKGKVVYRTDVLGAIPLYTSFRTAAVDTNLPLYTAFFITACVLLCGAALVLFITFRHFFNKPYAKLLGAMNEVSRGNFDVRLDDKISSDFQYIYDGFKMDAADPEYYPDGFVFSDGSQRSFQAKKWAEIGAKYAYNELRAGFNAGWLPVANRLRDKNHSWTADGLNTLVPDGLAMGLCGYQYLCPDMIGGGMVPDFHRAGFVFDSELFVRYCQVAAAFPMMQFSRAPWKVLGEAEQRLCLEAVALHTRMADTIVRLAEDCAATGEPMLRSLEYVFPHRGYAAVSDEFLLGNDILVAPQLQKGVQYRQVILPDGVWADENGRIYTGGTYTIETPLSRLPVFTRKDI